ncbi:terminase [Pendulispora albinea]|uniref:DUF962 domain-containing protein n=1 Tax=Pendulispora albinea TaxID=2741071 RepID=A0ABZ2M0L1_9BACT
MNTHEHDTVLARQWNGYGRVHSHRKNLIIHAVTVPLFMMGTLAMAAGILAPFTPAMHAGWQGVLGAIAGGFFAMIVAVAAQGRGHEKEANRPEPFRGPLDVLARLFFEQWITFPRYVLSGQFGRALFREEGSSRE